VISGELRRRFRLCGKADGFSMQEIKFLRQGRLLDEIEGQRPPQTILT
jgi:hypothetical protein